MSFHIYILKCSDGSHHTGHTDNLEPRVAAHQRGAIPGYTDTRRPVRLAFAEEFPSRVEALERKRQVKGWSRAKKEALIRGNWEKLVKLSKGRGSTSSSRTGSSGSTKSGSST